MVSSRPLAWLPDGLQGRLTALPGGHTNRCWRLDTARGRYWLRLGCAHPGRLGIDRRQELEAHRLAADAGLAPAIRFALPERGLLVLDWLDEPDWRQRSDPDLAGLMARVATLHRLPATLPVLDLRQRMQHYLGRLTAVPPALAACLPRFDEPALNPAFTPVFCHHDLTAGNLLGERPWLLDWEYAALGDAAFELAVIADGFGLDPAASAAMLAHYRAGGGELDPARLAARLCWVHLLTALWAAVQYQYLGTPSYLALQQGAEARLARALTQY